MVGILSSVLSCYAPSGLLPSRPGQRPVPVPAPHVEATASSPNGAANQGPKKIVLQCDDQKSHLWHAWHCNLHLPIPEAAKKPTTTEEEWVPWLLQWNLNSHAASCGIWCLRFYSVFGPGRLPSLWNWHRYVCWSWFLSLRDRYAVKRLFKDLDNYKFQSANQTWSTKKKEIFRRPFPSISQHFGILKLRLAQLVLPRAQRHLYWTTSVSNASWSCPHAQHTCGTGIVSCSVIRPILRNYCSMQNWETKHQLYNCT